jgi:hypothetical protein
MKNQWQLPKMCVLGACIEVKKNDDGSVLVRTTGEPNTTITATKEEWDAFIASAKTGQYDS